MDKNRGWKIISLGALVLLGTLGACILQLQSQPAQETFLPGDGRTTVVIDPGHGGEDGGAVAPDGTEESRVNLEIALKLDAMMGLCGQRTLLLRSEDISLHDEGAKTIREKKVSDIHNRVRAVNGQSNGVLISIHQNYYPSSKYAGTQVFYGGAPQGQPWAALTQRNCRECLDPDNHREAAPISRNVYLMNHVTCPAILVECGFLSNPEEKMKLLDRDHQISLAAVIAGSYIQFTNEKGAEGDVPQSKTGLLLHRVRQ